jgi:hypothetical protein
MADWRNWCAVRDLCQLLPSKCTFRKVSFYQQKHPTMNAQTNGFQFILLLEVENALVSKIILLNLQLFFGTFNFKSPFFN